MPPVFQVITCKVSDILVALMVIFELLLYVVEGAIFIRRSLLTLKIVSLVHRKNSRVNQMVQYVFFSVAPFIFEI